MFQQPHYTENFVQAIFDVVEGLAGGTLVVGGDGRFLVPEVVQIIIKMAKANGLAGLVVGQHGLYSTPAISATIRQRKLAGMCLPDPNPPSKVGFLGSASYKLLGLAGRLQAESSLRPATTREAPRKILASNTTLQTAVSR